MENDDDHDLKARNSVEVASPVDFSVAVSSPLEPALKNRTMESEVSKQKRKAFILVLQSMTKIFKI